METVGLRWLGNVRSVVDGVSVFGELTTELRRDAALDTEAGIEVRVRSSSDGRTRPVTMQVHYRYLNVREGADIFNEYELAGPPPLAPFLAKSRFDAVWRFTGVGTGQDLVYGLVFFIDLF